MTTLAQPRVPKFHCPCGRPGAVRDANGWACERCKAIERKQEHENRRDGGRLSRKYECHREQI